MTDQEKEDVVQLVNSLKGMATDFKAYGAIAERERILEIARNEQHRFIERGSFNYLDFERAVKEATSDTPS